jgi:hypothetical protein
MEKYKSLKGFLSEYETSFSIVSKLEDALNIVDLSDESLSDISAIVDRLRDNISQLKETNELFLGELNFLDAYLSGITENFSELSTYKEFSSFYVTINLIETRLNEIRNLTRSMNSGTFDSLVKKIQSEMSSSSKLEPLGYITKYDSADELMSILLESSDFTKDSISKLIFDLNDLAIKEGYSEKIGKLIIYSNMLSVRIRIPDESIIKSSIEDYCVKLESELGYDSIVLSEFKNNYSEYVLNNIISKS